MSVRTALLLPIVAGLGLLAGCGLLSKPATSWVGASDTTAVLVQFTRDGDDLQGTMDVTELAAADAVTADGDRFSFTGKVDGSRVTLTFPQGFGTSGMISGTMTRTKLALAFPDPVSGRLGTIELTPGGRTDYRSAAKKVTDRANANASQDPETRLTEASSTIESDVNELSEKLDAAPDFGQFDTDLATARKALDATNTAAAKATAEGRTSGGCADARTALSQATAVATASAAIDSDVMTVATGIEDINRVRLKLGDDYANFLDLLKTQGQTIDAENAAAVKDLQDRADRAVADWQKKTTDFQAQASKFVGQATAAAKAAQKAAC